MSQISKARERLMLHKKIQQSQAEQPQFIPSQRIPRKFTVSSLTHQFDNKGSDLDELHSPFTRQNTARMQFPESPRQVKIGRPFQSNAKENTPLMLKTINIKINEISRMQMPESQKNYEASQYDQQESHYYQSPPKAIKRLHKQKMDVLLAAPQIRRHHSPFKPAECLVQYAQSFIAQQKACGRSFVDKLFPPERTIIFNKKILSQQQGLKFQRLSRIYRNDITIVNNCEPTYISKGKYSNPYVYSALTILSEQPSRILQLFGEQQANQTGVYSVNICKDGVWRYIIIDDFVPVKAAVNRKYPLFLRSKQINGIIQIWPSLIEKALSKIYGTYLDLAYAQSEGMSDIFKALTGVPAHVYSLNKDFRSYLILIDAALKRKHIVTLQMVQQNYRQTAELKKLSANQAYRIVQIKKSGVRLRNLVEPDLITKLAFQQCLIFSKLIIYRTQSNYRYITHKLRHKKLFFSRLHLTIPTKTRGYFEVWQNNPAYYKRYIGSNIDYELAQVKIWIGAEQGDWIENGKEIELEPGEYEMHIHLCQQKQYDFTLSYYGQKEVTFQRIKNMQKWYQPCLCLSKN